MNRKFRFVIAGAAAGAVTGIFGAGGGMILVPMLTLLTDLQEEEVFPVSICVILPICLVSLVVHCLQALIPWQDAWGYLLGSALGGIGAGLWGQKIPAQWLHRALGLLILWGGIQRLC